MKYGLHVASCGDYANARTLADLARQAEAAGWDGFFIWDHVTMSPIEPQIDPWVALTAIALATERIRIGTMITPLSRCQPWQVARETVSLDHLSGGRLILGVGLGDSAQEFKQFGLPTDLKTRAALLDETLDVLTRLWIGEQFSYQGVHYHLENARFSPTPLQKPGIPIWVAGFWPNKGPFRRAARYDGAFPGKIGGNITPSDLHDLRSFISEQRNTDSTLDIAVMDATPGDKPHEAALQVAPLAAAGATWWLEPIHAWRGTFDEMKTRIAQGPPTIK